MIHQSGNILDIASATCSRSNRALYFVSEHRILSLMKDLCRAVNSCKAGQIASALRVACNGLCPAGRKSRMSLGMRPRIRLLTSLQLMSYPHEDAKSITTNSNFEQEVFKDGCRRNALAGTRPDSKKGAEPVFQMPTSLLSTFEERTRVKVSISRNLWIAELR